MPVDLAAIRERLEALAEQWRPSEPPAVDEASGDDVASGRGAPTRSPVRGLATVLAVLAVVVGWWWWQGRPRPVVAAPDLVAAGQPLTGSTPGPAPAGPPGVPPSPSARPAVTAAPGVPPSAAAAGEVPAAGGVPAPAGGTATAGGTAAATAPVTLVVHVAGPVRAPGVVQVPPGARVVDAVEAAGGLRPGAAVGDVNLARLVVDGERIDLGRRATPAGGSTAPGAASAPDGTGSPGAVGGPLDLNAATQAELEELPGVGPVLAGRILAWRSEHGRFSAVEELQEVSGIGDATYAELAPLVRV